MIQHCRKTLHLHLRANRLSLSHFSSLRSWRYYVGARLKFWRRSRVPKNGSRDKAVGISRGFAARDGSAVKSQLTILQWLRRQISLDYYTIPPATQATIFLAATAPFAKSHASYFRFARFNTSTLYYLRAWHRLTMKEVVVHIYRKIKQISVPFFRSCCVDPVLML